MKKLFFLITTLAVVCFGAFNTWAAAKPVIKETPLVKIIVEGVQIKPGSTPINCGGRSLLGLRDLLVALGVPNDSEHIIWNAEDKTIKVITDDTEIAMSIGNKNVTVNGADDLIDVEPVIYKSRTYIPARFVAMALSRQVLWDGSTNSIVIYKKETVEEINNMLSSEDSDEKIVHKVVSETLIQGGTTVYSSTDDVKSDQVKNIEYITSSNTNEGYSETVNYYMDEKYVYSRSSVRDKWLKQSKADLSGQKSKSVFDNEATNKAFQASLVLKEKNEQRIVLEGDNLAFAVDKTKGSPIDVTKDKTSRCHIIMEYDASTLKVVKMELCITGTNKSGKTYELKKTTEYLNDNMESVPVPSDLKNSYTIAKGFKEYYNNGGYAFILPNSWESPDTSVETPIIPWIDKSNPTKPCFIVFNRTFVGAEWTIAQIKTNVIKNMSDTVKSAKVLKTENIKWNNYPALRVTISGKDIDNGKAVKMQVLVVDYMNVLLNFTYYADTSVYDLKYKEAVNIINSWKDEAKG